MSLPDTVSDYTSKVFAELSDWKRTLSGDGVAIRTMNGEVSDWLLNNNRIMGAPPGWLPSTDPGDRWYNNVMMPRAPVIGIVPGIPKMSSLGKLTTDERATLERIAALSQNGDEEQSAKQIAALFSTNRNKSGSAKLPAVQFYEFKADYSQYYKYVQLMLLALSVMMDRPTGSNSLKNRYFYRFADEYEPELGNRSLSFWAERDSSITESANNEYGESKLAQAQEGLRDKANAVSYATGWASNDDPNGRLGALTGILSAGKGAREAAGTVLTGGKLLYPHDWQDSSFSKDISLSFKFTSPYGDPFSIFEYVYKPFISLLALALPRQTSSTGYASPFIIRIDSSGWFTCDMGAVTSFSWKKGGPEDDWTVDGYPKCISCTLQIADLLPAMMMTRFSSVVTSNPAMHAFLMNMAGIRVSDPFESGEASAKVWAAAKAQLIDPDSYFDGAKNIINDIVGNRAQDYKMVIGGLKAAGIM